MNGYRQVSRGNVQGRGDSHQTDAYGDYFLNIPFVHKIELLAEAKYWTDPVGINVGRDVSRESTRNQIFSGLAIQLQFHLVPSHYVDSGVTLDELYL